MDGYSEYSKGINIHTYKRPYILKAYENYTYIQKANNGKIN